MLLYIMLEFCIDDLEHHNGNIHFMVFSKHWQHGQVVVVAEWVRRLTL